MNYPSWNKILTEHFFNEGQAGKRVFLYCTEELIDELGSPDGNNLDDFVGAIKEGPDWAVQQGVCRRAYDTWAGWRDRGMDYPPYIAYLCFFVVAAGYEGEFDVRSYYPRLRELLGETPSTGGYQYFDRMLELWDDLEQWSAEDTAGELGVFRVFVQGRKIHIGVPLSQTFLTQQELAGLPSVFLEAGLDPEATPSDQELLSTVFMYGQALLRPPTLKLLDPGHLLNSDLQAALADTLRDELLVWDGQIQIVQEGQSVARRHVSIVICCENIDLVANRVRIVLRCRSVEGIPDDGLRLNCSTNSQLTVYCEPSVSPWSTALIDSTGAAANAAAFDWCQHYAFADDARTWHGRMAGRQVHILVSGESQGVQGFVGVNKLPAEQPFFLLIHEAICDEVAEWGAANCEGFSQLQISSGLPVVWRLFTAKSVLRDAKSPAKQSILAPPLSTRVTFTGGIRVARGNKYFSFSPPAILIEGVPEEGDVSIDDVHICEFSRGAVVTIPESALQEGSHVVSVQFDGQMVRRRLYLVTEFLWRGRLPRAMFDEFGNPRDDADVKSPAAAGAIVQNFDATEFSFNTLLGVSEHRRVFFVGKEPGQIVKWPSDRLPDSWSPVWAIPMERRGFAVFCGDNINGARPKQVKRKDSRGHRKWKEILWFKRRCIAPPKHPAVRALWETYQRAAKKL